MLGLFKSEEQKRAEDVRQGAVVPSRSERKRCWDSRDVYFACLDRAGVVDPVKDAKAAVKACGTESKAFEQNCAAQWVRRPSVGLRFCLSFLFSSLVYCFPLMSRASKPTPAASKQTTVR